MKQRKLLKTVVASAIVCVCSGAIFAGVLAQTTHTIDVSGQFNFSAVGVCGNITGSVSGYAYSGGYNTEVTSNLKTNNVLTNNDDPIGYSASFSNTTATLSSWEIGNLSIGTSQGYSSKVCINLTFENTGDNAMRVGISNLAGISNAQNLASFYKVKNSTTTLIAETMLLPQIVFDVEVGATKTVVISFYVENPAKTFTEIDLSTNQIQVDVASTESANWKTVTLDSNNGTDETQTTTVYTGRTMTLPTKTTFTKTNYSFSSWNTSADGSGTTITTVGDETGPFYAQWSLNQYSIYYELNGGTVASANPSTYNITTSDFTLTNPTKTGYAFTGWTGSNGNTAETTVTISQGSTGNKSYIANWSISSYSLAYELNGGTLATANPNTYNIESNFIFNNPTKAHSSFDGWFDNSSFTGTAITSMLGKTGDKTLYAKWIGETFNIIYKDQNNETFSGTTNPSPTTHTYGTETTLANPTKSGAYAFGGWFTTSDCSGTAVTTLGATAYEADMTLYAKWIQAPWTAMGTYTSGGTTNWAYDATTQTINYPSNALNGYYWVTFDTVDATDTSTWTRWIVIGGGNTTYAPSNAPTNAFSSTSQVDGLTSNQLLLLSERNLSDSVYWENDTTGDNSSIDCSIWNNLSQSLTTNVRGWCENYYTTNFSSISSSIVSQTMKTCDYYHGGEGSSDTTNCATASTTVQTSSTSDHLFLLANKQFYGSDITVNSNVYATQNFIIENYLTTNATRITYNQAGDSTSYFWLRSGSYCDISVAWDVIGGGFISNHYIYNDYGARPCFVLDLGTVTFDANGGSGTQDSLNANLGSSTTLPECTFTAPSGYVFDGWNTSADGSGTTYSAGSTFTPTTKTTLYPKWTLAPGLYTTGTTTLATVTVNSEEVDATWANLVAGSYVSGSSGTLYGRSNTTSMSGDLVIPNGVTSIGSTAFGSCTGLTTVTIPNGVTSIGEYAFYRCTGLTTVTIPNGVTSIGKEAFFGCSSLTSITIPNGVTSIGAKVFYACSSLVGAIAIPNSVTSIGDEVFHHCTNLTSVTLPNSLTSIGEWFFSSCTNLTSITLPNSLTNIGNSAFQHCTSLTSITIPNSVISIGDQAFYNCSGLTSITIPNGVTSIGNYAFYSCSGLTGTFTIPNGVTSIGSGVFNGCSGLTTITIPSNVTSIGGGAFYGCSGLTGTFTIPNGVTSIGNYTFYGCSGLTSITIPNGVTSIGSNAFESCRNLTSITIPNGVTSIGTVAFWGCRSLTSITIPTSVTSIVGSVFGVCDSLTSVTIPSSVTSIGDSAFYYCSSLNSVYYGGDATSWGSISIGSSNDKLTAATKYYYAGDTALTTTANTAVNLPTITLSDGTNAITISSAWQVLKPDGTIESISGTTFTPTTAGVYTLIATCTHSTNKTFKVQVKLTVT